MAGEAGDGCQLRRAWGWRSGVPIKAGATARCEDEGCGDDAGVGVWGKGECGESDEGGEDRCRGLGWKEAGCKKGI